ncbi:MAG TPA: DUF3298 domain-containing protein [bacterium]|nr:MAG: Peptidoglycan-N-acetylmuramic acid deacetylase PdaC [Parcubacteria group bacterium ADurb.Bin192]HPN14686.1 DUF3298 domain-containing protein [bacterium]
MKKYFILSMALMLLGAGCLNKQANDQINSIIPPPAQEPGTASGIVADWQTYANDLYGFELKYPASAKVEHSALSSSFNLLSLNLGTSTFADYAPGASLEVFVIEQNTQVKEHYNLSNGCYDELAGNVETERVELAGAQACKTYGRDAGAGNYYDTYWHTLPLNDKYLVIGYTVHSVNCGNVGDGKTCAVFDESRDTDWLNKILGTLKLYPAEIQKDQAYFFDSGLFQRKLHYYAVDFKYPVMLGTSESTRNFVNRAIQDYVATTTGAFIDYATPVNDDGRPGPYMLEVEYNATLAAADILSFVFNGYEYSGGVHGMPIHKTFIFNLKTHKSLELGDLFKPEVDYLKIISDYCIQDLLKKQISETDWVNNGAAPKKENYELYYLTKQGLTIIFPAYQVASYADGPQEVTIPYDKLQNNMRPDVLSLITSDR